MKKTLLFFLILIFFISCGRKELKKDEAIKIISQYYQLPFQTKIAINVFYDNYGWAPEKYRQLANDGLITLLEQRGSIYHKRFKVFATEKAREYWIQNGTMQSIDEKIKLLIFKGYKIDIQNVSISSNAKDNKAEADVVFTISDVSPFQKIFSPLEQTEIRKILNFKLFDDGWKIIDDENSKNIFKSIIVPLHWAEGGQINFDDTPLEIAEAPQLMEEDEVASDVIEEQRINDSIAAAEYAKMH